MKQMFRNVGFGAVGPVAAGIMNVEGSNRFMAQGAQNRREAMGNFYGLSRDIQGMDNMETQRFNQRLLQEETALGTAMQTGIGNMFSGADSGSNFMQTESAIDSYAKMFKEGEGGDGGFDMDKLPTWLQKMGKNKGWFDSEV